MPPADPTSKKPGSDDSLLGDFDFGDEDFNWDKLADVPASTSFNSEDELPPELRKAVVKEPDPQPVQAKANADDSAAAKPVPTAAKSSDVAPIVAPQKSATAESVVDPLALPPLDGEAAPLPPLGAGGSLLGDFDLDFPVGPAKT
ncbi:MAG TPA: hypothetical protein PKO07_06545, partial [Pseudomonadota bacterium]|nr:hypothetical protein [Pseudomonadota bacterium]HNF96222.1 hypothetical protein [Pseudomonadota bacterium]HNN50663.1 hypothetical protein [Pseudomonadota bacterium]